MGGFKAHIAALCDGLIETEARRIVRNEAELNEPKKPGQDPFHGRELSPALFMRFPDIKDTDCPFPHAAHKTLFPSGKIGGQEGTYALIAWGEPGQEMCPCPLLPKSRLRQRPGP